MDDWSHVPHPDVPEPDAIFRDNIHFRYEEGDIIYRYQGQAEEFRFPHRDPDDAIPRHYQDRGAGTLILEMYDLTKTQLIHDMLFTAAYYYVLFLWQICEVNQNQRATYCYLARAEGGDEHGQIRLFYSMTKEDYNAKRYMDVVDVNFVEEDRRVLRVLEDAELDSFTRQLRRRLERERRTEAQRLEEAGEGPAAPAEGGPGSARS